MSCWAVSVNWQMCCPCSSLCIVLFAECVCVLGGGHLVSVEALQEVNQNASHIYNTTLKMQWGMHSPNMGTGTRACVMCTFLHIEIN